MQTTISAHLTIIGLLSLLIIACSAPSVAQTIVPPGPVTGLWDTAHSPYLVQGDISVPDDSTLTIDPGVRVEFQGHFGLHVQGRLLAVGTHTDSITFTVNDTTGFHDADTTLGGWYGIRLIDVPLHNDTTRLAYCKIEYGKAVEGDWFLNAGGGMCILHFDKVVISNSLFTNCSAGGPNLAVGGAIAAAWSGIQIYHTVFSHNRADAGGAIHFYESDPVLEGNVFEYNLAQSGGALDLQTKSHVTLRRNAIKNNTASGNGGGIMIGGDSVVVTSAGDTLTGNFAVHGGAVDLSFGELFFTDGVIWGNGAELFGGGVNAYMSSLTVSDCTVDGDTSAHAGGAVNLTKSSCLIDNSSVRNTSAVNDGGAILASASTVRINNSTFSAGTAVWGGVLYASGSDVEITNSTFSGNYAEHGGVLNGNTGTVLLRNSSFMSNTGIWGGAMSTLNMNIEIDSCTFRENTAQLEGGVFEYWADTAGFTHPYSLTMKNSTFEGNQSVGRSGVMLIEQTGTTDMLIDLLIDGCDFIDNTANIVGVSRLGGLADFTIINSRFIGNTVTQRTAGLAIGSITGNVTNCLFLDHRNPNGPAAGVGMLASAGANFINCTFVNRADSGTNGITLRGGATASVVNSIFRGNGQRQFGLTAVADTTPCHLYINYSNIQYGTDSIGLNDTVSVLHWGSGNLADDPKFLDPAGGDFRLQDTSPCIAAGTDSVEIAGQWYFAPSVDLDGTPRPNPPGTRPDAGAFESLSPITGVNEQHALPARYALHQNYPNPFNPATIISYDLPRASMVSLLVYDILGRRVAILVDENQPAGEKNVKFDGRHLPSGVYVYRLHAGDFYSVRKLLLIR